MALPINVEDLLSAHTVESERIEYKEGWNPDAIYRGICAFANDFDNIGGGYICIGVEEDATTKTAKRPVKGISTSKIAEIQQKMIGLNQLINPTYDAKLSVENVDGKQIIVLWIPGGSNRPYQVPDMVTAKTKKYFYYIRKYASSVKANEKEQQELISLANQVPFDDRPNTQAQIENISLVLVKDYLHKTQSKLAEEVGKKADLEILGQMELISGPSEHVYPRNVALMLFSERPDKYFPYSQVDIVEFPDGDAGDHVEQQPITGPVPEQIARGLTFLKDKLIKEKVIKPANRAESIRITSYPYQAIEETLVNAFYHRDYQQREPIEIRIYPNSIVFLNHGGPDRSIRIEAFSQGQVRSRRYRNRRLGEFLKELELTEGRATGIPTILESLRENGSPEPRFNTDEDRSFFEVELFIHPSFSKTDKQVDEPDIDAINEVNARLNVLIEDAPSRIRDNVRDVAGDVAGDVAADAIRNKIAKGDLAIAGDIVRAVERDIAVDIAIDAQQFINEKVEKILLFCRKPQQRKDIMEHIGLVNNVKNYDTYMAPLVQMGWVNMTIPDKPTSPKQQYKITLKGAIITELMNYIDDEE